DAVAVRPLQLGGRGAAWRLVAADAGDPGVVRAERLEQRLDLANVTATVRVGLPEVGTFGLVLLGDRDHVRLPQLQAVALDEPVARLVRLTKEELRVELDHR